MRIPFGIALLVVLCLVAFNLPQASAGRRYKRVCDLVGCKRCYTPARTCYGRICQEQYACQEDMCGDGFVFNPLSDMCDCKPDHGIILGRCTYKRYWRTPGFSAYYAGIYGYNKMPHKFYRPRGRGYGPNSYGYRPSYYVGGPYCQNCPPGTTSPGGEPLHTFCLPDNKPSTITLVTQPTGPNAYFDVKVDFNVAGGCQNYLTRADVRFVSAPLGITCNPTHVDVDCHATTKCKASKVDTFQLSAKLNVVAGVVTDKVTVVVSEVQPPADATTTVVTIEAKLAEVTMEQTPGLHRAATEAAKELNDALTGGHPGVTLEATLIEAVQGVNKAAVEVKVSAVAAGSIQIIYAIKGDPEKVTGALPVIAAAWPQVLANLVTKLQLLSIPNTTGDLVNTNDVSAVILVGGKPTTDNPIEPSQPPDDGEEDGERMVRVDALAKVDTSTLLAELGGVDPVPILEASILNAARTLAMNMDDLAGTTVVSVKVTKSTGGTKSTPVVVMLTAPGNKAATVVGWLAIKGNKNIIREAVWTTVAELAGVALGEFDITIKASIEPPTPPK